MAVTRRASQFDPNIDPELLRSFEEFAATYAPYDIELFSGYRPNPSRRLSQHGPLAQGRKGAIDFRLKDKRTGRELPTARDPSSGQAYQQAVNAWYQTLTPEQQQLARWGGYFSDFPDWMHVDFGGADRQQAGNWKTGFGQDRMAALGYTDPGGLDAAMKAAGYTPEQRRNAIAAIESAGSGDYGALGKQIARGRGGEGGEERPDRAYGRYQVMGSNIAPWAQQYLQMAGVTPEQFLADPALQDKLFDAVYGDYVTKYGERGAASKWFTGSEKEPDRTDANGKYTGKSYADMYMEQLTRGAVAKGEATPYPSVDAAGPTVSPKAGPKKKGFWDKFASGMGDSAGPAVQSAMPYGASQMPPAAVASAEPVSMVNPEQIKMQREMLAQALAALQGSGYGQQQG